MFFALAGAVAALPRLVKTIELQGETHHVQGIELVGKNFLITSVGRIERRAFVFEFDSRGHKLRETQIQVGERFHPGGLCVEDGSFWTAVAEYKPKSNAIVERRSVKTFEIEREFEVADHIGCVAAHGDRVWGANWNAELIYEWTRRGRQVSVRRNPHGVAYQDMKYVDGMIVAGGINQTGGFVDWLDPKKLALRRRLTFGRTDRGVLYTHEGMALRDGLLYLLPEDAPSRVFVFEVPRVN